MLNAATTTCIDDLPSTWRARADELRRWAAAEAAACALERAAQELDDRLRERSSELLSLSEASEEGGYSVDHLGRLIREGRIPNAGRPNAPRIRRADLPRK